MEACGRSPPKVQHLNKASQHSYHFFFKLSSDLENINNQVVFTNNKLLLSFFFSFLMLVNLTSH